MDRKSRREIGAYLASKMATEHTLAETGKCLGMDKSYVRRIEQDALWKIFIRMQEVK